MTKADLQPVVTRLNRLTRGIDDISKALAETQEELQNLANDVNALVEAWNAEGTGTSDIRKVTSRANGVRGGRPKRALIEARQRRAELLADMEAHTTAPDKDGNCDLFADDERARQLAIVEAQIETLENERLQNAVQRATRLEQERAEKKAQLEASEGQVASGEVTGEG